jgi:hypothetical protein
MQAGPGMTYRASADMRSSSLSAVSVTIYAVSASAGRVMKISQIAGAGAADGMAPHAVFWFWRGAVYVAILAFVMCRGCVHRACMTYHAGCNMFDRLPTDCRGRGGCGADRDTAAASIRGQCRSS